MFHLYLDLKVRNSHRILHHPQSFGGNNEHLINSLHQEALRLLLTLFFCLLVLPLAQY